MICGEQGVGKSTLIKKLLEDNAKPLHGFVTCCTKRDEDGFHNIYMHSPNDSVKTRSAENYIGRSNRRQKEINLTVFDTLGLELLNAPHGGIIIMDELGFMEAGSAAFCEKVLECLDGDVPVLAAVKDKKLDFLDRVRSHPKAQVFYINENNRDKLYPILKELMEQWDA